LSDPVDKTRPRRRPKGGLKIGKKRVIGRGRNSKKLNLGEGGARPWISSHEDWDYDDKVFTITKARASSAKTETSRKQGEKWEKKKEIRRGGGGKEEKI